MNWETLSYSLTFIFRTTEYPPHPNWTSSIASTTCTIREKEEPAVCERWGGRNNKAGNETYLLLLRQRTAPWFSQLTRSISFNSFSLWDENYFRDNCASTICYLSLFFLPEIFHSHEKSFKMEENRSQPCSENRSKREISTTNTYPITSQLPILQTYSKKNKYIRFQNHGSSRRHRRIFFPCWAEITITKWYR